jgi:hypothetical protein
MITEMPTSEPHNDYHIVIKKYPALLVNAIILLSIAFNSIIYKYLHFCHSN